MNNTNDKQKSRDEQFLGMNIIFAQRIITFAL